MSQSPYPTDLTAALPQIAEKVAAGWGDVLTKLTVTVSSSPAEVEMQKPVFTETMQIWIVVRNLDAAIRRYENDYGIGPWGVHEFNPGDLHDLREYG